MKIINSIVLITFGVVAINLSGQQTVGLFLNSEESFNGYTLFAPIGSKTSYLIDNCGEKVHSWSSSYRPGQSVYLLENGILLRTGNANNSTFGSAGGAGGIIEMIDWEGNIIWDYKISTDTECQHHDIEYLPNGNILALVWEKKTKAEAIFAGRTISGNSLWTEKVVEIKPDLTNGGGKIVWEWKVWDHLVQEADATKSNYGSISGSPQLININFYSNNANISDWLHTNSVDYNARLDQIVISCHNFSEIWIIDHSTTITESSGHEGSVSGKGGDLLFRWGNPQTYNQGSSDDQKLFLQHNANWIEDSRTDGGMIMIFNNQAGKKSNYSTVNVIETPINTDMSYTYYGTAFAPSEFHWTYKADIPTSFYAANISGATRLTNGNTLICEGTSGTFFEVDKSGIMVWKYVNPVTGAGILSQGTFPVQNSCFRAERYAPDFKGFDGKTLIPQDYIESGSTFNCTLFVAGIDDLSSGVNVNVYPNPAKNQISISSHDIISSVSVYNFIGEKVLCQTIDQNDITINIGLLPNGVYIINSMMIDGRLLSKKFVKSE